MKFFTTERVLARTKISPKAKIYTHNAADCPSLTTTRAGRHAPDIIEADTSDILAKYARVMPESFVRCTFCHKLPRAPRVSKTLPKTYTPTVIVEPVIETIYPIREEIIIWTCSDNSEYTKELEAYQHELNLTRARLLERRRT